MLDTDLAPLFECRVYRVFDTGTMYIEQSYNIHDTFSLQLYNAAPLLSEWTKTNRRKDFISIHLLKKLAAI